MTREHWKDLIEVIGGFAIVASLIFVGLETRNNALQAELNTRAIEIAAYQDLIDNISQMNALTIENEYVANLMYKSLTNGEELTELERFRLSRAFFLRFRHGDMAYFQYERGAIDEERLRSVLKPLNLSEPLVRDFWNRNQENFTREYREYLNALISVADTGQ
jgi:hypothetical protein